MFTKIKKYIYSTKIVKFIRRDIWWTITCNLSLYKEKAIRGFEYFKFGWNDFDYDGISTYSILEFKFKRLLKSMQEDPFHKRDKVGLDALKEAINICKELYAEDHYLKYMKLVDKKWGRLELKPGPKGSNMSILSRKKAKTPKQKFKAERDAMEADRLGEIDRKALIDRLATILKDHAPRWWN